MKKKGLLVFILALFATFAIIPLGFLGANDTIPGTLLVVTKTATGSSQGYLTWSIDKSVDNTSFYLTTGETATANYTVTVTPEYHETGRTVEGIIHIENVGGVYASGFSIIDIVEYKVGSTWQVLETKGISGLFTIDAGNFLDLPYSVSFIPVEGATAYRNKVIATLNNYALPEGGTSSHDYDYITEFSVSGGTISADAFAYVSDSLQGYLGQAWVGDTNTYTYSYSLPIGPYTAPGDYNVENIATVTGVDTGNVSTDSVAIKVHVAIPKQEALINSGIPGKGLANAPGQQKAFNPKSQASVHAGMKK